MKANSFGQMFFGTVVLFFEVIVASFLEFLASVRRRLQIGSADGVPTAIAHAAKHDVADRYRCAEILAGERYRPGEISRSERANLASPQLCSGGLRGTAAELRSHGGYAAAFGSALKTDSAILFYEN